mmetsp:Transcript_20291/g.17528  ORF Transcript_20291/g.17528 Transcript_20291/m.17528 type:complete len:82 (+) Transcript_20291:1501-1746(+)
MQAQAKSNFLNDIKNTRKAMSDGEVMDIKDTDFENAYQQEGDFDGDDQEIDIHDSYIDDDNLENQLMGDIMNKDLNPQAKG